MGQECGKNLRWITTDSDGSVNARSKGSIFEQVGRHCSSSIPKTSEACAEAGYDLWNPLPPTTCKSQSWQHGALSRCFFLRKKTEDPISNPPLPLSTIHPSPSHDPQVCLKNIGPHYSSERKENRDKETIYSIDNIILYYYIAIIILGYYIIYIYYLYNILLDSSKII